MILISTSTEDFEHKQTCQKDLKILITITYKNVLVWVSLLINGYQKTYRGKSCYPYFADEEIEVLGRKTAYSALSNQLDPKFLRSNSILCLRDHNSTDYIGYT